MLQREKTMKKQLSITIDYDSDVECPTEWGCEWSLYSFCRKHGNFKQPYSFITWDNERNVVGSNIGMRRKLNVGTAFLLSYFEHGQCVWSLKGEGPQCQWDTAQVAGILIWEHPVKELGPKTYTGRVKDARIFLDTYTKWCNGDCYYYCIEDAEENCVDSCGGYIGTEYMIRMLKEEHPELFDGSADVEYKGRAEDILK